MFKLKRDQNVATDEYIESLKRVTAGYEAGINWHTNGIATDEFFASVANILPKGRFDHDSSIMYQLVFSLKQLISTTGDKELDLDALTYQAIINYICKHQDKLADNIHTYRVILYLLNEDAIS